MTYEKLWNRLCTVYDAGEAKAIVRMVLDERFGLSAADVYCGKVTQLSSDEQAELEKIMLRLEQAEPVQYVLGWANFCNRQFSVAPGVLIPRPETEELCSWITEDVGNRQQPAILDIGTGSGCIAWTMALELPGSQVTAVDLSEDALKVAASQDFTEEISRTRASAPIFLKADVLDVTPDSFPRDCDLILSNPPYVMDREKALMRSNVLDHEPHMALFVPDHDPLLFYKAVARHASSLLASEGVGIVEINEALGEETAAVFRMAGFGRAEVVNDLNDKARFVLFSWK